MGKSANLANIGAVADTPLSFRNKLHNGDMRIAQRGTLFASTALTTGAWAADRWQVIGTATTAAATISQGTSVPNNTYQNNAAVQITTADASIASGDAAWVQQGVEGFNARDLIGQDFTISFWVRSAKTGTHCVALRNSGSDRSYVATYTVNAADTWEYKTITVSGGLITAGTWDWTNGLGFYLRFALAAGSTFQTTANAWQTGNFLATSAQVNCLDTVGNVFAITGVQLEMGTQATPFERRQYGTELALCQRYYFSSGGAHEYIAFLDGNSGDYPSLGHMVWPATMRSTPSISSFTFTTFGYNNGTGTTGFTPSGGTAIYYGNGQCGYLAQGGISNYPGAAQSAKAGYWNGVTFGLSAEL